MSYASAVLAGRYRLDEPIAVGSVGEVWRGLDSVLERPVAVKLLRAEFSQHADTLARFRAEARHAGSLSHPDVAHVYDYVEPDPPHPPFLVMELVDGPSLRGVLANGPLAPVKVMDVVAQAAAGLQAAHKVGLVHRDIKPANLLLDKTGLVKITDFGIAHAAGSAPITRTGQVIGTPSYLAPERVGGASATPASDLYSLGVVAYEALAGGSPFTGTPLEVALAHRHKQFPPLPVTVPPEVAALVTELISKDPAGRPASAELVAGRAGAIRDRLAGTATLVQPVDFDEAAKMAEVAELARSAMSSRGTRPSRAWRPNGTRLNGIGLNSTGLNGTGAVNGAPLLPPVPPVTPLSRVPAATPGPPADAFAPTMSDIPVQDQTQADRPAWQRSTWQRPSWQRPSRQRSTPGRRRAAPQRPALRPGLLAGVGVAAVALIAIVLALTLSPGGHQPASAASSPGTPTTSSSAVSMTTKVDVNAPALVGHPLQAVREQLQQLGLHVRVQQRHTGAQRPGRVVAVQPGGRVQTGTTVTVVVALAPVQHKHKGDQGDGHGHHHGDG